MPCLIFQPTPIEYLPMNQMTLLRESRAKHLLKDADAAANQLRVFKAIQPVTSNNSASSGNTPLNGGFSSRARRKR